MPLIEIKTWTDGRVLFSGEYVSLKAAVEAAVRKEVNLSGSDLSWSNLSDSDLSGSDLSESNLSGSDLSGSDLSESNLSGSDISWSDLSGSNLSGIKVSYNSHDLLAEILKRAAGDDTEKLKIAGYILVCRNKCWKDFADLARHDPLGDWALDELAKWVQDGDDAPNVLRERAAKLKEVVAT